MDLRGRSFLKLFDYNKEEIEYLLKSSYNFKKMKKEGKVHRYLEGKNIALIFEKTSTRTRCAFEVASYDLGVNPSFIDAKTSQIGSKESIKDSARVLGRMYDGIEYRGYGQEIVEQLAKYSKIPVWNGLTDEFHPTQALADALTIFEKKGKFEDVKVVFMGDCRNNVANSLMIICAYLGMNYVACGPKNLFPSEEIYEKVLEISKITGSKIEVSEDISKALINADVIYTDVWVSMGEDKSKWKERIDNLKAYQVNMEVMKKAKEDAIFMHCLPSYHNLETEISKNIYEEFGLKELEVTDEVFESDYSVVFDQAENRMHCIKAIIYETLKGNGNK